MVEQDKIFSEDDKLYLKAQELYEQQQADKRQKEVHKIYNDLVGDGVPPTDKQLKYAKSISEALEEPLPENRTKTSIGQFITKHVKDFKVYQTNRFEELHREY